MSQAAQIKKNKSDAPLLQYQTSHRILVVEDEAEIGQIYREILQAKSGKVIPLRSSRVIAKKADDSQTQEFDLVVVQRADEALAHVKDSLAKGKPFAMGFFDVLLGGDKDGIQLVKEIHALQPDLYAVFVTAYNDRSVDSIRTLLGETQLSYWDYINKPFSPGEILQKARNFVSLWNLNRERLAREELLTEVHRQLLENERMTSVAAVARGVSHEFGNILMQIMGKADLALSKNEVGMRESLERILSASQKAAEILDRFKQLSSPHAVQEKHSLVDVRRLIDDVVDLLEHTLKTSDTKICKIKMDPVQLFANPTALMQVLVNLTINSIHAMGKNGQIDISVTALQDVVELRVRDYGPGVKPEIINRILEPFFTTKGKQGTGLGLAIVKEIIETEHQGEIQVQNNPIKGFEVIMRLPLTIQEEGKGHE